MTKFWLQRDEDISGTSGTGIVAEGIIFKNGKCVLSWLTDISSICIYNDIKQLEKIHGHEGRTKIKYD